MIVGDGLMSHQPMIETVKENGMHYRFVAKPGDHAYLFEWIDAFEILPTRDVTDDKGQRHQYRWQNDVPLQGEKEAIRVNFFEYSLFNEKGKRTYRNSGVTDVSITNNNIEKMTKAGRCRWKIETECFNTLKNQGYYIEQTLAMGNRT